MAETNTRDTFYDWIVQEHGQPTADTYRQYRLRDSALSPNETLHQILNEDRDDVEITLLPFTSD